MGTMAQNWLSFDQVVELIWSGDPVLDLALILVFSLIFFLECRD